MFGLRGVPIDPFPGVAYSLITIDAAMGQHGSRRQPANRQNDEWLSVLASGARTIGTITDYDSRNPYLAAINSIPEKMPAAALRTI